MAYADGSVVGDSNGIYRTDENGEIRIPGLKPGKSLVVTEVRAPVGFILDTQIQTIQIQAGKTVCKTKFYTATSSGCVELNRAWPLDPAIA